MVAGWLGGLLVTARQLWRRSYQAHGYCRPGRRHRAVHSACTLRGNAIRVSVAFAAICRNEHRAYAIAGNCAGRDRRFNVCGRGGHGVQVPVGARLHHRRRDLCNRRRRRRDPCASVVFFAESPWRSCCRRLHHWSDVRLRALGGVRAAVRGRQHGRLEHAGADQYGAMGRIWQYVREEIPPGAKIAYANTYFTYPLMGFSYDHRLAYAPTRTGLDRFVDMPAIGGTVSGEQITGRVVEMLHEHPDEAQWLAPCVARGRSTSWWASVWRRHEKSRPRRRSRLRPGIHRDL